MGSLSRGAASSTRGYTQSECDAAPPSQNSICQQRGGAGPLGGSTRGPGEQSSLLGIFVRVALLQVSALAGEQEEEDEEEDRVELDGMSDTDGSQLCL